MNGFTWAVGMEFSSVILLSLEKYISNEKESKSHLTDFKIIAMSNSFLRTCQKKSPISWRSSTKKIRHIIQKTDI